MGIRFDPDEPSGRTEPGFITRTWLRLRGTQPGHPAPPPASYDTASSFDTPPSFGTPLAVVPEPVVEREPGAPGRLTAEDVIAVRFSTAQFREGYDQAEVDAFLDLVVSSLRDRAAGRPGELSGTDVVNTFFSATRFRAGYDQSEVDDFLDRVVEALA